VTQVYLARFTGHDIHYTLGEVVKRTPSGCVDVKIGDGSPMRFRPDGKLQGASGYHNYQLDEATFEERTAYLEKQQRTRAAANSLRDVALEAGKYNPNYRWGKEDLLNEITRLQSLLNTAKEKAEAI